MTSRKKQTYEAADRVPASSVVEFVRRRRGFIPDILLLITFFYPARWYSQRQVEPGNTNNLL
jgi:hypothetical protein